MLIQDAPPPGWYPDPEGGSRLRWWEGTDWSDRFRAPPTSGIVRRMEQLAAEAAAASVSNQHQYSQLPPAPDTSQIVNQVRDAAREEAARAADLFSARARRATEGLTPLISEYTNRFIRFFRRAMVVAFVLIVAWFVFQAFAQITFFEWLGDRIDNLSDNTGSIVSFRRR